MAKLVNELYKDGKLALKNLKNDVDGANSIVKLQDLIKEIIKYFEADIKEKKEK